ncbi:hypothetical protein PPL_07855 [Heterostelium album PN500]|uniref:Chitinase n=1 Tax=Heterostelium pallidum (strain ATCC 26659 / Pp 5 / PN500) TaxID=670386 RepID=D3BH53_HETP5|nr:hypothetical protein PPL_07855 [Heterostelium album PN500]EFA79437.1 hypothetical protein PPL_07855 [Heterostelium album PN500]|eukprot:XP_020431558.1 hypothetical protein PPL_07855 [Heterostelium album PN500]
MKFYLSLVLLLSVLSFSYSKPSDLGKVYAIWHCGIDGCMWNTPINNSYVDWIVNRGDGIPTNNLFIFSFLNPVNILQQGIQAVPAGMSKSLIQYLQSQGLSVMFSIGGAGIVLNSWSSEWDQALTKDPTTLGKNAAAIAQEFGVGIEIDYESEANTPKLDAFVKAYRSVIPFDNSSSATDSSLLTVDTGAGTGYLTSVSLWASKWLEANEINWINAMVTGGPYGSLSEATQYWNEHLYGTNWASIPPMRPEHLVVSLYSCDGSPNCNSYQGTVLQAAVGWVNNATTRGISFWVGGCVGGLNNNCCNDCTGLEQGSKNYLS